MPETQNQNSLELPREGIDFQYKVAYPDGLSNRVVVYYIDRENKKMALLDALGLPGMGAEYTIQGLHLDIKAKAGMNVSIRQGEYNKPLEAPALEDEIKKLISSAEASGANVVESTSSGNLNEIIAVHFDRYKNQIMPLASQAAKLLDAFFLANPRYLGLRQLPLAPKGE